MEHGMTITDETPAVDTAKPQFWRVRLTHHTHNKRTVFRSVSENRARAWLIGHFPRGSEAYLESPLGLTYHYEHERAGERGVDVAQWAEFDPETWVPVEQQVPPGQDAWADKEG